MRLLCPLVPMLLLVACDEPSAASPDRQSAVPASAAPSTVETPPASARPRATARTRIAPFPTGAPPSVTTASAAASAAASPPASAAGGLLGAIATATEIKVSRVEGTDSATLEDPDEIKKLLDAIDLTQKPGDVCPKGLPTFTLSFKDGFGKRLGSLGIYAKPSGELAPKAALRDALGDACQSVELKKAPDLRSLLETTLPLSKSGG